MGFKIQFKPGNKQKGEIKNKINKNKSLIKRVEFFTQIVML